MTEHFRCKALVNQKIAHILGRDPSHLRPASVAALAQLRHAAPHAPGASPEVWDITLEGIPESLSPKVRERVEQAVHLALTQFALHQQSQSISMHQPGEHFGRAVRKLADATTASDAHESPAYTRFMAMARSTNLNALRTHSRGLISQLRSRALPFDYGEYADDLYWFLTPGFAVDVQRRWGRHFHALEPRTPEGELS